MGSFSELIKNFDKTRSYVRDFFIYGYKVRSDFSVKSSRTYDDEKRRVESWLGDYISYSTSERGKQTCISVDSSHIAENPLYNAYYSKSFTTNDIRLHFFILDILSDNQHMSLKELSQEIDSRFGIVYEEQTIRLKLKEYTVEGIIITEKSGKTAYYSLSPDTADSFMDSFSGLPDAVRFFSEQQDFGIIGNSLMRLADMHNDIFRMKHNYIVHTLEDILLPDIIQAIDEKRFITAVIFNSRNSDMHNTTLIPFQIISSVRTGRRYLACYDTLFKNVCTVRLGYIKSVKIGEVCQNYSVIQKKYRKCLSRSYCVSMSHPKDISPLVLIIRTEPDETFIPERIRREMRLSSLEDLGGGRFRLTIDCDDPNEAIPWVKSFIGRIESIEGGNSMIINRFFRDICRMKQMYRGEGE